MIRFFSQGESRRKSRRFVPSGLPVGVCVEHLEVRAMLDGSDITQTVRNIMDLVDADLARNVGSGDEAAHFDGMEMGGTDSGYIEDAIEAARTDLHTRLDAKITAWTDYKTLLQSDIIRIRNYASDAGWAANWFESQSLSPAQTELFNRLANLQEKIDTIDPKLTRLSNLEAWDDTVFDFLHAAIEYHRQQMGVDGDGNPTYMRWMTVESFAEAEDDLLGA